MANLPAIGMDSAAERGVFVFSRHACIAFHVSQLRIFLARGAAGADSSGIYS